MARMLVAPGVFVDVSGDVQVAFRPPAAGAAVAAAPTGSPVSPIKTGLIKAGFVIAADIRLTPVPGPGAGVAAAATPAPAPRIVVQTDPGEHAVVLLERVGGVYAWSYPLAATAAGPALDASQGSILEFDLGAEPSHSDHLSLDLGHLFDVSSIFHWAASKLGDGVKALVLKFVVGKIEDAIIEKEEGAAVTGLTVLFGTDALQWVPANSGAAADLTPNLDKLGKTKGKVLLMVHGTFSNTKGSFGPLAQTPEGRAFLDQAWEAYDGVIGFDHKTLAASVTENATAIAAAIKGLNLPDGTVIDAAAYSRGGLVYREFAETLAPTALPGLVMGKAAFVACTNGGTHLADPANWKTLVDLYTNAAVLGANVVAGLGGQPLAGAIATDVIDTVGQLVKYMSVVGVTDRRVPGLADMLPSGPLVTRLKTAIPADLPLGRTPPPYFAITCDFDGTKVTPPATPQLQEVLADPIIDKLFGDANDLVVDTQFMTDFGNRQGQLEAGDTFSWGTTGDAYHTVYFAKGPTAHALGRWLP